MQLAIPQRPSLVTAFTRPLLDALFPPRCPVCGLADAGRSFGCARHEPLLALPPPRCGRCAVSLPSALPHGAACRACRENPPAFERVVALGEYARAGHVGGDALREWILAFKHGARPDLAPWLGGALAVRLAECRGAGQDPARTLLVPIPLHPRRRFERGYDQARLLAREVARVEGLAMCAVLARTRATLPQGSPFAPTRDANVRGAFRMRRSVWGSLRRAFGSLRGVPGSLRGVQGSLRSTQRALAGRDVWLVDDVLTSGATANACAELVLDAGAASASVLVLARAEGHMHAHSSRAPESADDAAEVQSLR